MSSFASFLQAMSSAALDTLQGFDAHAALNAGIDPAKVRTWAQLHDVYLSPSSSSIMQMHAEAAAKARHGRFSLDQLALIERRLKPLPTSRERARRRLELLDMLLERRPSSYQSFARAIREFMPINPKPPRQGVSFSRSRAGVRTMRVTASERDLADLEHALLRGLQPRTSAGSHMLAQFLRLMRGAGGAEGTVGVAHAAPSAAHPTAGLDQTARRQRRRRDPRLDRRNHHERGRVLKPLLHQQLVSPRGGSVPPTRRGSKPLPHTPAREPQAT